MSRIAVMHSTPSNATSPIASPTNSAKPAAALRSGKRIRVMVVDDSNLMRRQICDALLQHPDLEVVAEASDGIAALRLLDECRPDVVTLDLLMPRLGGLDTLDGILKQRPTPVIVFSSLTQRSADATWEALDRGALDYVPKPEGVAQARLILENELPQKIRNMAGANIELVLKYRKLRTARKRSSAASIDAVKADDLPQLAQSCIAIGISTGGPPALAQLFAELEAPLPPVVVVQHMPALFTGPFAERLNSLGRLTVREARDGEPLRPNVALVAPGGRHLKLRRRGAETIAQVFDAEHVSGHRPSVDVLMTSAAECFGPHCLGVIMTGMGRDGADGCRAIRAAGGYVLGQDEASSDVYGMNKVAYVEGHVDKQVPLARLPSHIESHARRLAKR
ncbi:MAG: chemotaxis response regulator protein-glutamate methylesterase [Pirellula sp.]|nr:chemotaxis response regulator protein-glutamate methylesterase [Pirellula sp.]